MSPRDRYLETEVTTATPQKRQLMLIQGAIRFIERARAHWRAEEDEAAHECLVRVQQIVTEMLSSLNHEIAPELSKRVASLYLFVFRTLVDANLRRNEAKLDDALKVLEPQREAWQGVCKELESTTAQENQAAVASFSQQDSPLRAPSVPPPSVDAGMSGEPSTGFSIEA
ncbi:MAG: flagellar export chaperone FliS [Planctomycetota bacterium]